MEIEVIILLILLSLVVPAYLASLLCRLLICRGQNPGWYLAILASLGAGFLNFLCVAQFEIFDMKFWHGEDYSLLVSVLTTGICIVIGLLSASIVVIKYKARFKEKSKDEAK